MKYWLEKESIMRCCLGNESIMMCCLRNEVVKGIDWACIVRKFYLNIFCSEIMFVCCSQHMCALYVA